MSRFLEFQFIFLKTSDIFGDQVLEDAKTEEFFTILQTKHQDASNFLGSELYLTLDKISRGSLICKVEEQNLDKFHRLYESKAAENKIKTFLKDLVGCSLNPELKIDIICVPSHHYLEAAQR